MFGTELVVWMDTSISPACSQTLVSTALGVGLLQLHTIPSPTPSR